MSDELQDALALEDALAQCDSAATDRDLLQRAKEALVYAHRWMEHGCSGESCEVRDAVAAIEARLKETP